MQKSLERKSFTEKVCLGELPASRCPSREVLQHVCSLWGVLCLTALSQGQMRYNEIRRKAVGISEKMLIQTLKQLERDGFILRTAYPVVPPHVEYRLTELGEDVAARVGELADWIDMNIDVIEAAQWEKDAN